MSLYSCSRNPLQGWGSNLDISKFAHEQKCLSRKPKNDLESKFLPEEQHHKFHGTKNPMTNHCNTSGFKRKTKIIPQKAAAAKVRWLCLCREQLQRQPCCCIFPEAKPVIPVLKFIISPQFPEFLSLFPHVSFSDFQQWWWVIPVWDFLPATPYLGKSYSWKSPLFSVKGKEKLFIRLQKKKKKSGREL